MPRKSSHMIFTQPSHQRGRLQLVVAGSLVAIAALWFGADAITSNSQQGQAVGVMANTTSPSELEDNLAEGRAAIEELKVTASRIQRTEIRFEEPVSEFALTGPEDPKQFWQGSDS